MDTNNLTTPVKTVEVKSSGLVGTAIIAGVAILAYKTVCRASGFRMVRPHSYDDKFFYVATRSGKILKCAKENLSNS